MKPFILTTFLFLAFCSTTVIGHSRGSSEIKRQLEPDRADHQGTRGIIARQEHQTLPYINDNAINSKELLEECYCEDIPQKECSTKDPCFMIYLSKEEICILNTTKKCSSLHNKLIKISKFDKANLKILPISKNGNIKITPSKENTDESMKYNTSDTSIIFSSYAGNSKIEISLTEINIRELHKAKENTHSLAFKIFRLILEIYIAAGIMIALAWIFFTCIGFNSKLVEWRVNKFNSEQLKLSVSSQQSYQDSFNEEPNDKESKQSETKVHQDTHRESIPKPINLSMSSDSCNNVGNCTPTLENPGIGLTKNIILSAFKHKLFSSTDHEDLENSTK
ncbi:unnamed protein product [Moneuplotes crassus]|uniref:Uncharacterized protein n=1 Tax=Euplotes crassus TaxID=5936 RepID=A0AAD1UTK1_EUPCR|nr:unnamed protein product [Moneuplotes crassus]